MLRERKASMAERSLSSLTGELLLLATAAAAFAIFAARRLGGEEHPWKRAEGGVTVALGRFGFIVGVEVVWKYEREKCGFQSKPEDSRNHHPSTRATWAGHRRNTHAGVGIRSTKVKGQVSHDGGRNQEQCRKGPGWHNHPPKITTTTQHQIVGGSGGGQMKKKTKTKTISEN